MIQLVNVSKKIGDEWVLKSINLELEENKIYGFQGRNGSGKTMLFRAMTGLIVLDEGTIQFQDQIVDNKNPLRAAGLLLENPAFLDDMSAFENLQLLAFLREDVKFGEIDVLLDEVGLAYARNKSFGKYSLGMKQRLGIAATLLGSPKYIFLDEPTNALDLEGVDLLKEILLRRKEEGATIFLSSHEPEILELLADELIHMESGQVVER